MKPIRLEMRGINSFREIQSVDFSKLSQRGIFGIFGPTGSGKSTILDAMTLALYNETARKSKEYLNLDSKDLFVSFEFEVGTDTGRAAYVVERGKKRDKDGKIKSTIDRLYKKGGTGEIIEGSGQVNRTIVNLLGLTMDDFTRSVVIPQGKFSDFLKLAGANRKKMLERILKLQEFGELLTMRVKRKKEENEKRLHGAKEALKAYEGLEIERLDEFRDELLLLQRNIEELSECEKNMRAELRISEEFWQKKDRLESIDIMIESSEAEKEAMNALLKKCEMAKRVMEMGPCLKEKREAGKEIAEIEINIKEIAEKIEQSEKTKELFEKQLKIAAEKKEKDYEPLMVKSLAMKHMIENENKSLEVLERKIRLQEDLIEKGSKQMAEVGISMSARMERIKKTSRDLEAKENELELLERENLLFKVGKKLSVGDSCPICGNEIKQFVFLENGDADEAKESMYRIENELSGLEKSFDSEEKKMETEKETAIRLEYEIKNMKKQVSEDRVEEKRLKDKVETVFMKKNPETALLGVKKEIEKLASAKKDAEEKLASVKKEIEEASKKISEYNRSLDRNIERRRIALKTLEKEMQKAGIVNEEDISSFICSDVELKSMEDLYRKWNDKRIRLNVQKEDVLAELKVMDVAGSREDFEKSKEKHIQIQKSIEDSNEKSIRLKERTEQMEKNLEKVADLEKKKKKMEKDGDLLDEITALLRGNAFVGFVAMRHLRYIVRDASVRLLDITGGRYRLEIDSRGEFVISDNFSGGSRRGCDTLSGGETFIVSLVLALALSAKIQMNSVNNLEFFFLDEGFGTLDKDVLDVVMDSLERIREKDLTVGLISHVEALKDRVPVKLVVDPAEPGVSGSSIKMEYM